jgi:hypothetical protein
VRWWAVRLLFEHALDGRPPEEALYEEEFRVFPAMSETEAMTRAREAGRQRADDAATLTFCDLLDVREARGAPAGEEEVISRQLTWQEVQVLRQTLQAGGGFLN